MNKFSQEIKEIIKISRNEALRLGNEFVGTEHLLLGILNGKDYFANKVLQSLEVDISELAEYVERSIDTRRGKSEEYLKEQELDRKVIEEKLDKHDVRLVLSGPNGRRAG